MKKETYPIDIGPIEGDVPLPPKYKGGPKKLPTIFPLYKMGVGESFEVRRGYPADDEFYTRVTSRVRSEAQREGMKVQILSTAYDPNRNKTIHSVTAIRVWRTA